MPYTIENAAILGSSGTIGSLTGGLLAQQGIKVAFLSRTMEGAKRGLKKAIEQARSEVISRYIECLDYEHGLEPAIDEADLVIESVSEDMATKRRMYAMVERYRRPETIVGTTTSSLPLSLLTEGRSDGFKSHFLSTHFYNPPSRMLACEVARTQATEPHVHDRIVSFLEQRLRRVVVPVKNTPAYAGNRIAFVLFDRIVHLAELYGVEMMDYLIGPYTGRLMAPLATLDLVGLDVHLAIVNSIKENTREEGKGLADAAYVKEMVSRGLLGRKSGEGFYKLLDNGRRVFYDPSSRDYVAGIEPHVRFVEKAKQYIRYAKYKEALDVVRSAKGTEANIVKEILARYLQLAFSLVGVVTEENHGVSGIDQVMSFGFNWAPPSALAVLLGGRQATEDFLLEMGLSTPASLKREDVLSDQPSFDCGRYFVAK